MQTIFLAAVLTLAPGVSGDEIVQSVVESGYRRVGVVPIVITQQEDSEVTVGRLGPRARSIAHEVYDTLVTASQQGPHAGRFQVVPERVMMHALRNGNYSAEDLADPRKVRALAQQIGMDGMVTLTYDTQENLPAFGARGIILEEEPAENADPQPETAEPGDPQKSTPDAKPARSDPNTPKVTEPESTEPKATRRPNDDRSPQRRPATPSESRPQPDRQKVGAEGVDTQQGNATFTTKLDDPMTLSKAAYQGKSWELRRWQGERLVNVGLPSMRGDDAFGMGTDWELVQHAEIDPSIQHPRLIPDFPYSFDIKVRGQIQTPYSHQELQLLELNEGDEFEVVFRNKSPKDVIVALYVDGLSSIDKKLAEPNLLEAERHWLIPADGSPRAIAGWYTLGSSGQQTYYEKFRVVDRADSVAAKTGFDPKNIGMVTAIFYSVGTDGFPHPQPPARHGLASRGIGVGAGERVNMNLTRTQVKPGIILAASTYYYRTRQEIAEIKQGDGDLFGNKLALQETPDRRTPQRTEPEKKEDLFGPESEGEKKDHKQPIREAEDDTLERSETVNPGRPRNAEGEEEVEPGDDDPPARPRRKLE